MFSSIGSHTILGLKVYLILAMISAGFAGFLFGVNTGNIAGALPFITQQMHTTLIQNECLVASTILCAALSALINVRMSRKYGLRKVLLFTGVCFLVGAFIAGISDSFYALLLGRAVLGFAIGISSFTAPLYIADIAPTEYRGFFVLLNGLAITSGEAVAFYVDYHYSASGQWRVMIMWSIVPALIFLTCMFFMPCAPRWHLAQGRDRLAHRLLKSLHSEKTAKMLLNDMKVIQKEPVIALRSFLRQKQYRTPLMIGLGLGIFQQFFGINTIMYYGPFIFEKAGFPLTSTAIWATFIMGVFNIFTTMVTALLVDIIGRRKLLLLGSCIAWVSLLSIAYLFYDDMGTIQSYCILLLMIMYMIGYCMSVGSLFWLMIAEIFPLSMKERGASIATSVQWFSNFIVSFTFLSLLNRWGASATFFIYSTVCCTAMFFVYYFIPETKN